jgi:hypothetical protein
VLQRTIDAMNGTSSPETPTPPSTRESYRGRVALLVVLLVSGVLTGCGNTGSNSASRGSGGAHTISFPIVHETHEDIVADVAACREGVDLATWLSRGSKIDLYESCNKGLKRGLTEVRQYGEQVCSEVVFTMPSAKASEKTRVLDACEAKTKKFSPAQ